MTYDCGLLLQQVLVVALEEERTKHEAKLQEAVEVRSLNMHIYRCIHIHYHPAHTSHIHPAWADTQTQQCTHN